MYESKYDQSDKLKSADFWEEIIITSTVEKLKTARTF